jgi:crotonobetainyl-CoA:carnitine CoA-transferase CaiB-like acyl-CoA transferase
MTGNSANSIIGVPGLADDPRFAANRGRVENRNALIPILVEPMKARTTHEWVAALEAAAVPCGPINNLAEVFSDPQVVAREMALRIKRQDGVDTPTVANPVRFSATPVEYRKAAPKLGEDTADVLSELLGLTASEIARLKATGAIG